MTKLKLFVWENVLTDYTSGMICTLAENLEQAFDLLYEKDSIAWSQMQGIWNSEAFSFESEQMKEIVKKYTKKDLTFLQKKRLEQMKVKVCNTHIPPKVVKVPKAFVVYGGG